MTVNYPLSLQDIVFYTSTFFSPPFVHRMSKAGLNQGSRGCPACLSLMEVELAEQPSSLCYPLQTAFCCSNTGEQVQFQKGWTGWTWSRKGYFLRGQSALPQSERGEKTAVGLLSKKRKKKRKKKKDPVCRLVSQNDELFLPSDDK